MPTFRENYLHDVIVYKLSTFPVPLSTHFWDNSPLIRNNDNTFVRISLQVFYNWSYGNDLEKITRMKEV